MKEKTLQEKKFRRADNFFTCGLVISKLLICAISFPTMIWGMTMAHQAESMSFSEITGVFIAIVSVVVYFLLNLKKFVDWGIDIGDYMFSIFCPKLYKV
ncbi:MAG: hypothetical protein ACYC40_03400 [Patescibacteria group bacterium]